MSNEIKKEVEEIKQEPQVKRALQQTRPSEATERPKAQTRDKLLVGTHAVLILALGAFYYFAWTSILWFCRRLPGSTSQVNPRRCDGGALFSDPEVTGCLLDWACAKRGLSLQPPPRLASAYLVVALVCTHHVLLPELVHRRCFFRFDFFNTWICAPDSNYQFHRLDLHSGSS
jgi:hypothetical protein